MANRQDQDVVRLFATSSLPDLGPGPRDGALSESSLSQACEKAFATGAVTGTSRELIRALALLWHDHLDAAHRIVQDLGSLDGAFVHAIMHRREPDYSNAKYWFRHVGRHGAFPGIASRATAVLGSRGQAELAERLVPDGQWDAFCFVDLCEEASRSTASAERRQLLREIQAAETQALLECFGR